MHLEDRILFIDGDAIVIDKPAGLPVDQPRLGGDSIEYRIAGADARVQARRRRRCTGSTRTRRAACCSRATRAPAQPGGVRSGMVEKYYLALLGAEIGARRG